MSDFPILDVKIIEQYITFGSYQISQSFGYLAEHFKANGRYIIKINNELVEERFKILSAEIQSRHKKKTKYKVFISYLPNSSDPNSIEGWACNCHSGTRTVGCCSHNACIIYYLSYAKHRD